MARRTREQMPVWPSWRYGPNGERLIFNTANDVPYGWTKKPQDIFVGVDANRLDRQQLIVDLEAKEIKVLGHWSTSYMKELLDQ